MRRRPRRSLYRLLLPLAALLLCDGRLPASVPPQAAGSLDERARRLAREMLLVDTHIDVPYRLSEKMEDLGERTTGGEFDHPRAVQGGLDAAFMSIYVPARYEAGGARAFADRLIRLVEGVVRKSPGKFALARTPEDVRRNTAAGKISLPMGMENGSPIEGKLSNVRYFRTRGICYITLAHSKNNHICDSSYDDAPRWNGLSPFGRSVVEEMNRVGIMVDVSHVTDSAFTQILRITRVPVIASHSACRHFTPGWERNMSDEMIRALAANGGVIQINFGSMFLRNDIRTGTDRSRADIAAWLAENNLTERDGRAQEYIREYKRRNGLLYATVSDVADHIDHAVRLAGVDHVGIGSDFDGLGDSLPIGLKDVSGYPVLIEELLRRGYSEEDLRKICGENTLRVWSVVEEYAASAGGRQ
jgi:membrane dipeptidase